MPFVPFPFFVALLMLLLLFYVVKQDRDRTDGHNFPFLLLIVMSILQSTLLGLRWGYDIASVRFISPIVASMVPPLVYLGVAEFVRGRRTYRLRVISIHAIPALVVVWLMIYWPVGIDLTLVLVFMGYAVATLGLTWRGQDSLGFTSLEDIVPVYRAIVFASGALLFSAVIDMFVYLAFIWDLKDYAITALIVGDLIVLLILGTAAAAASRGKFIEGTREIDGRPSIDVAVGETMERVNTFMHERKLYRDANLNLDRLARKLLIPSRQISQAVNIVVGQNVSQYVNSFRIAEACDLLENTEKSVTEIMFDVGFQTKSNFNREFRRITDMTPKDWRVARTNI